MMGRVSLRKEREKWLRFFKFPREYGFRINGNFYRGGYIIDWDELNVLLQRFENKDIHLGIFSVEQIKTSTYDTVLMDIDAHDGDYEGAWKKVRKIVDILENKSLSYRLYFTGRGFNVYVDFEPLYFENYKWVVIQFLKSLLGEKYKWLDSAVIGDVRRVPKLPGVYNSLGGYYVIGVSPSFSINKILKRAEIGKQYPQKLEYVELDFEKYNEEFRKVREKYEDNIQTLNFEVFPFQTEHDFPPCIRRILNKLKTVGDLSHDEKFMLRTFLLRLWKCEDIYKLFEKYMKTFLPDRVVYQLNYAVENDYKPYSCRLARELGICPYDDLRNCLFYTLSSGSLYRILPQLDKNNMCKEVDKFGNY